MALRLKQRGFTLTELMIGILIALLTTFIIFRVFADSEARRRSSVAGNDASSGGAIASYLIGREVASAGFGLFNALTGQPYCTSLNSYNSAASTPLSSGALLAPALLRDGDTASDMLEVVYSTNQRNSLPVKLSEVMSSGDGAFKLASTVGFAAGDVVLAATPYTTSSIQTNYACGRFAVTAVDHSTLSVSHASSNAYNPSSATVQQSLMPNGALLSVKPQSYLINMGSFAHRRLRLMCNTLVLQDLNATTTPSCTAPNTFSGVQALVPDVLDMQTQYGVSSAAGQTEISAWVAPTDSWADSALTATLLKRIVAVRVALIVRVGTREKTEISPASLAYWADGSAGSYTVSDRHYRYQVFRVSQPIRNAIWSDNS